MGDRRRGWVALGLLTQLNPRYRCHLEVGSVIPGALADPSPEGLERALSLRPQEARDIFSRNFPEWADKEIEAAGKAGVALLTFEDEGYPVGLRNLPDPPPILYVRGQLEPDDTVAVAVVGSRRATPYGLRVAEALGRDLAETGFTVVSGLARGIDTAAHRGALAVGGRTIGVLGSGIDVVYPKENGRMYERVAAAGAVMTEYAFGAGPQPHHFPIRNRLIAGLSEAVVVVEAARESGSLITAKLAADELGRPVCAVPGPITSPTSEGCNDLIYDGATPVRGVRDILEELPPAVQERAGRRAAGAARDRSVSSARPRAEAGEGATSAMARRVLGCLSFETPMSADELAASAGLPASRLLGYLLELEIAGLVSSLPGGLFVKKD